VKSQNISKDACFGFSPLITAPCSTPRRSSCRTQNA